MEEERMEEPTSGMETPSKARRQKEANSSMGEKGCKAWIPIFGAARAMDYVTIANLAVTNHGMKKVCEDEIVMRKECELGHTKNPSFFMPDQDFDKKSILFNAKPGFLQKIHPFLF